MANLQTDLVCDFVEARDDRFALLYIQTVSLHQDINSRNYVIPCLRGEVLQCLDTMKTISKKMAVHSSNHPYVLLSQEDFYNTTVPAHCAELKAQFNHFADRLRDNESTDIPLAVAKQFHEFGANLTFCLVPVSSSATYSSPRRNAHPPPHQIGSSQSRLLLPGRAHSLHQRFAGERR
jgi:hypothetical protein